MQVAEREASTTVNTHDKSTSLPQRGGSISSSISSHPFVCTDQRITARLVKLLLLRAGVALNSDIVGKVYFPVTTLSCQ